MTIKYLIFDFDGVLGDTFEGRNRALKQMETRSQQDNILSGNDYLTKSPHTRNDNISGNDYLTKSPHTRNDNISADDLDKMKRWARDFGDLLVKYDFALFSEFIQEISKIENTKLAIVSSGSIIYIKPKIETTNLNFSHVLSFEDHHSKEEKVEVVCKDWNVSVKDIYFFTDTLSDVAELEQLLDRNKIYGCAWGYQGYDKLATVLDEEHILKNFSDIHKIF